MKIQKGEKGYRNARKKRMLTLVIILGAAIMLQLLARLFVATDAARNILTVMAVLTVLPTANCAAPLIASWKYREPAGTFYQEMAAYEEKADVLYELVITSKDFIMPADAAVVYPQGVIVYCPADKPEAKQAEHFLNEMLKGQKLDMNAKVIKDQKAFFRRLDNLHPAESGGKSPSHSSAESGGKSPSQASAESGEVAYAADLLKSISM